MFKPAVVRQAAVGRRLPAPARSFHPQPARSQRRRSPAAGGPPPPRVAPSLAGRAGLVISPGNTPWPLAVTLLEKSRLEGGGLVGCAGFAGRSPYTAFSRPGRLVLRFPGRNGFVESPNFCGKGD
eukprot:gene1653-biopygen21373